MTENEAERIEYSNSTIFVAFKFNAATSAINALLREEGLNGTLVSTTVKRYAVEVPYGEESKYIKLFSEDDMVISVAEGVVKGNKITRHKKRFKRKRSWEN